MDKSALESSLNTLDIWLIVFGILVAIGVAGESVVGFLHWRRSGELQGLQTSENLVLHHDIETLAFDAEAAKGVIAEANARAAEATAFSFYHMMSSCRSLLLQRRNNL